jgi:hypothetical protein
VQSTSSPAGKGNANRERKSSAGKLRNLQCWKPRYSLHTS